MNSDQDIKMFSKEISIAQGVTPVIDLLDTTGNFVPCDYIEIDTNLTTGGFYQVIPSGMNSFTVSAAGGDTYDTITDVSATTATSDGSAGWVGSNTKTLKISLPWKNRTSRITIQNVVATTVFFIRYGISRAKNQKREQSPNASRGN